MCLKNQTNASQTIAGNILVGSYCKFSNQGGIVHPQTTIQDLDELSSLLQVRFKVCDPGTIVISHHQKILSGTSCGGNGEQRKRCDFGWSCCERLGCVLWIGHHFYRTSGASTCTSVTITLRYVLSRDSVIFLCCHRLLKTYSS